MLLLQTRTMLDEPPIFPLGLAYLAPALRAEGHHVYVYDSNIGLGTERAMERAIKAVKPEIVGVSIRNIKNARPGSHQSDIDEHRATIRFIRAQAPAATIVAGGAGFSLYGKELMTQIPEFDVAVFGEGEETFPELLSNLQSPQDVLGVLWRDGDQIEFTGRRPPLDFRSLGRPTHHHLDVGAYARESMGIGIQAKRGCALDCIHCSNHYLFQRKLRMREPGDVVDEIEELVQDHGLRHFMFADEIFNLPRRHAREICEEMLRRNLRLRWTAWFKESEITEESVRLFQRAGCQGLFFSPDVASDELLSLWGKGLKEEHLYQAMEIVKRTGLPAEWNFMVNGPGESWSSLMKVAKFLGIASLKLGRKLRLTSYFILVVRIYPHTRLQEVAIHDGIIRADDDLIEPAYYNPPPKSRFLNPLISILGAAWQTRQFVRTLKNPGIHRD